MALLIGAAALFWERYFRIPRYFHIFHKFQVRRRPILNAKKRDRTARVAPSAEPRMMHSTPAGVPVQLAVSNARQPGRGKNRDFAAGDAAWATGLAHLQTFPTTIAQPHDHSTRFEYNTIGVIIWTI